MNQNDPPVTLAAALEETSRLRAELAQLRQAEACAARSEGVTDELTGLKNRRYFNLLFMEEQKRAHREGRTLTLLLTAIDSFEAYNDSHGAPSGDLLLQAVAGALGAALNRPGDLAFRLGGDEFACLFVTTVERESLELAERICQLVEARAIEHAGSVPHAVATLSAGVAFLRPDAELALVDACTLAEQALHRARHNGRNTASR